MFPYLFWCWRFNLKSTPFLWRPFSCGIDKSKVFLCERETRETQDAFSAFTPRPLDVVVFLSVVGQTSRPQSCEGRVPKKQHNQIKQQVRHGSPVKFNKSTTSKVSLQNGLATRLELQPKNLWQHLATKFYVQNGLASTLPLQNNQAWKIGGGLGAQFYTYNLVPTWFLTDRLQPKTKKTWLQKGCLWNLRATGFIKKMAPTACLSFDVPICPHGLPQTNFL